MISFILNYRFRILFFSEIVAWILLLPMGYFRHWEPSLPLFILFTVLSGFFGYVPHFGIPLLTCYVEKSWKALYNNKSSLIFSCLVLLIIVFGLTFGKEYVLKIDGMLYEFAQQQKEALQTK